MITFEGMDRRMPKIEACLHQYGIADLEAARALCLQHGIDVESIVKGIQPIAFDNAVWAYTIGTAVALAAGTREATEAARKIGEGLQAFTVPGSVAETREVGTGHGNLAAMLLDEDTRCFCLLAGHESFAAAEGGIGFALLRCGFRRYVSGALEQDTLFEANYSGAGQAGLRRGVYFFSQAVSVAEAQEEAAFVLQMLAGRPLELPIFYDWETVTAEEGRANGLDGKTVTACAAAFCRAIEQAGYTAGIYFNLQMGYHTYNLSPLKDYTLWIAEPGKYPSFYYHAALWQYDHSGTVPGIDTPADRNLLFEGL